MTSDELLSLQESAKILGIKPITLRKWDREGKLKAVRVGSRRDRRYRRKDLDAFLMRGSSTAQTPWLENIRSHVSYHIAAAASNALMEGKWTTLHRNLQRHMTYQRGDTLYWCYDAKELYAVGHAIVQKCIQNPGFLRQFLQDWDQGVEKLYTFLDRYKDASAFPRSARDLRELYAEFTKLYNRAYGNAMVIDPLDDALMRDITRLVRAAVQTVMGPKFNDRTYTAVYTLLTQPEVVPPVNRAKDAILAVAQLLATKKLTKTSAAYTEKVEAIVDECWWVYAGFGRFTRAQAVIEVQRAINEAAKRTPRLILEDLSQTAEARSIVRAILRHNSQLHKLLDLYNTIIVYHDKRKEMQMRATHWGYALIDAIGKALGVAPQTLEWADSEEIIDMLRNQPAVEVQELARRSVSYIRIWQDGKLVFQASGREADQRYAAEVQQLPDTVADMQGITASGGKVSGRAYVALSTKEALQSPPGSVLITGMTTPDFLPAMRKALAIVTDEGGMTCHAAIIARELNIPCIVGTNYATKLIKTGQLVEVAANHGVVRLFSTA